MADVDFDDGRSQHGFPRGYHFVPSQLELFRLLDDKLAGRPLPHPLPNIFHDLRIRDFHPAELHEEYKEHEEAGYIYFFSERELPALGSGGKKHRAARGAKSGCWKASGGGKAVKTMRNGGVDVWQKLTMVFYQRKFNGDKDPDKTDWGIHEFTKIVGPDNKLADTALYRLYKIRSGKQNKKADRRVGATTSSGASELPASPTVTALPSPCQAAGGTVMVNQASVASRAQAQASVEQGHNYHEHAFGAAASAPGPSSWVMPATENPPAQLHGAGHAGYVGLTGSPAQAANHSEYAGLAEWHKMLQMVPPTLPPPPPPAPLMASGPATAAHDLPTTQKRAAEHFGYPVLAGWNEQLLKMDLASPLPPPARAAEGYLADEFNMWCEMQQVSSPAADPQFPMPGDDLPMLTDDELQQYTFTTDELLGVMDDGTVPTTVTEEAGTSNTPTDGSQVQGSCQQDTSVAAS